MIFPDFVFVLYLHGKIKIIIKKKGIGCPCMFFSKRNNGRAATCNRVGVHVHPVHYIRPVHYFLFFSLFYRVTITTSISVFRMTYCSNEVQHRTLAVEFRKEHPLKMLEYFTKLNPQ